MLLVAFLVGGRWGTPVAALLVGLLPAALFALGVGAKIRRPSRSIVLWSLLLALSGGVLAVYLTASGAASEIWWAGFPLPTALLIYGVGLGSLVATGAFYAATFDRLGIDSEDLERLDRLTGGEAGRDPA